MQSSLLSFLGAECEALEGGEGQTSLNFIFLLLARLELHSSLFFSLFFLRLVVENVQCHHRLR